MNKDIILTQVKATTNANNFQSFFENEFIPKDRFILNLWDKFIGDPDQTYTLNDFLDDSKIDFLEAIKIYLKRYSKIPENEIDDLFNDYKYQDLLIEVEDIIRESSL